GAAGDGAQDAACQAAGVVGQQAQGQAGPPAGAAGQLAPDIVQQGAGQQARSHLHQHVAGLQAGQAVGGGVAFVGAPGHQAAVGPDIAGDVIQDQAVDLALAVQGVVADVGVGESHPVQAVQADRPGAAVGQGVQDLHVVGQLVVPQSAVGGAEQAAHRFLADGLQLFPLRAGGDGHQPSGGDVQVLVHADAADGAVGAQHPDRLHHVGAVIGGQGAAGGLHYAVVA